MIVAQQPAPVGQDLAVQLLGLGVPAGLPGQPGQVLPAGQAVGMIRAQDPAVAALAAGQAALPRPGQAGRRVGIPAR